jgi:hypothetical protein
MAFCTACGASLTGAFCTNCGTPVAKAAASPQASGAAAAPAPTPAPARRKTSPIVWVLIVILGFCALGVAGLIGTGVFLARRGPGYAIAKIIAAANPNAEVVSTDDGAGTITIRDRRTNKTVTMSFDDARRGRFRLEAEDENGKHAALEIGGSANLPAWVPSYPGSHPNTVFSAKGESDDGAGEGGNFTFTTSDPSAKVRSFYEDEGRRLGMDVNVKTDTQAANVLVMKDPDDRRTLTVVIGSSGGDTTVNVTYGRKR